MHSHFCAKAFVEDGRMWCYRCGVPVEILNPVESTKSNIYSRALVTSIRGPYDRPNCHTNLPDGASRVNFNGRSPISTSICTLGAVGAPMWPHSKAYSYLNQNILVTPILTHELTLHQ